MNKKILVIDDEQMIRDSFKIRLEFEGHEVMVAEDGFEAMKLVETNTFDFVISDIIMPEKEGIETIREIHTKYPNIRIIAISGGGKISPENYLNIAKKMGAETAFKKPIIMDDLIEYLVN